MRRSRPYHIKTSHWRHDTAYLKQGTATETTYCYACKQTILAGATLWYVDVGAPDGVPKAIGLECQHKFTGIGSSQSPYWIAKPSMAACDNMRTLDDKGWREYSDGIADEWLEIWGMDLVPEDGGESTNGVPRGLFTYKW
jgi:hypothetical protein